MRSLSGPCRTGESSRYLIHLGLSVFLERCNLTFHLSFLSFTHEWKCFFYIWYSLCYSLTYQIYHAEKFVKPGSLHAFLLCSACQSFDQGLMCSSRRRSRLALGKVTQTITVTKGPKVCHLAWVFHSNYRQRWQKSGFWVKIPAPETGKLYFPMSVTLYSLSREVLTMTALIKELVDVICIFVLYNFRVDNQKSPPASCYKSISAEATPPSFIMSLPFWDAIIWW